MTNLYPGMLFYSSGLNRKSTPVAPEATPSEIEHRLGRAPFNGRPWPKSSPISHVYDVRNSSTRMIILNNKLSKKPKGSRLRGQTDHQGDIERPEPFRHTSDEPHTNWHHHKKCATSVSERFVPIFPQGTSPAPAWVNKTQRPAMKFDNGSSVNPNHHIQCQGHMDYDIVRWYNTQRRPRSRTSSTKESRALSPIVNDPNLTRGEKRYLNHIAKIYSVDNMRVQKQLQYNELMWSEIRKGRIRQSDWEKYYKYLNTPRKTQYGPCDPTRSSRSVSAPGTNRNDDHDDSRPYTTQTGAKRSSREPSTPGSTARKGQRSSGQKYLKGGSKSGRKGDDMTGKPARVESPLPLVPRKDSLSSISSGENESANIHDEPKRKGNSSEENDTGRTEQEKRDDEDIKPKEKESVTAKSQIGLHQDNRKRAEEDVDKRKEEDEDERSKISARDNERNEESNGQTETYFPTYNERVEEEERSTNEKTTKGGQGSPKEHYTRKDDTKNSRLEDNPVVMLPQSKDKNNDSSNNKSSDDSWKDGKVDDSDEMDHGPQLIHHLHKEGGDRPLSRLGGRGQFTLVKKDTTYNSDDDYSDDDEETPQKNEEFKGEDNKNVSDLPKTGSDGRGTKDSSTAQQHKGQKDPNFKLSLGEEKFVEGVSEEGKETNPLPVSPTEASSHEKPSTITTLEY